MRHINQRRTTDCFSACLASLLSVPLETVPHFFRRTRTAEALYAQAQRWLARHHGLTIVTVLRPDGVRISDLVSLAPVPAKFIATVPVIGGFHCVVAGVYRSQLRVVHNPDGGSKVDLRKCNDFSFLVPLFKKGTSCRA